MALIIVGVWGILEGSCGDLGLGFSTSEYWGFRV